MPDALPISSGIRNVCALFSFRVRDLPAKSETRELGEIIVVLTSYYSVECIEELCDILKITLISMQDLCVCIILSINNPNNTNTVGPLSAQTVVETDSNKQHKCVIATASYTVNVNIGLYTFQLVPMDEKAVKSMMAAQLLLNHHC